MLLHLIAGGGALLMLAAGVGMAAARRSASAVSWFAAFLCAAALTCAGAGADHAGVLLGAALSVCVFATAALLAGDGEGRASRVAGWRVVISLGVVAAVSASMAALLWAAPALGVAMPGAHGAAAMALPQITGQTGSRDPAAVSHAVIRGLDLVLIAGLFAVLVAIAVRPAGPTQPHGDRP